MLVILGVRTSMNNLTEPKPTAAMTKSMIRNMKSFADFENVRTITLSESLYLVSFANRISRKILIMFDIFELIDSIKAVKHIS